MDKKSELMKVLAKRIRILLEQLPLNFEDLQEIRLRVNGPLLIIYRGREYFVSEAPALGSDRAQAVIVDKQDVQETLEYVGNYSLYAFEDEVKQGFITIQGGHRVGIAGKTIVEGDRVKSLKYISFLNIRVSHQIKGCADPVLPYIRNGNQIRHTLIISPPRCGKTTLLRDMIRQISDGQGSFAGQTVGVVDERSEIGGSYLGVPGNDLGIRTDVMDCCPKAEGMMMLIRSMAPQVIAVDEIGDYQDAHAIESVIHCGCKLIATVHGSSLQDILQKPLLEKLVAERTFDRYIILCNGKRVGTVQDIFDAKGDSLLRRGCAGC